MEYKLQDLIDIEHFQNLQDRLNKIYSFPSSIIDNDGNILTATAWQDVCTQFHRTNKDSERECIKSDQYIRDHLHEADPAVSYRCPHGLVDNATPIIIDGIHYGNFFTGQFFLEEPDLEFFKAQAKKYGFDEDAYIEAIKKVPIWTQEQVDNYLFFIKGLIAVISESGLKRLSEIENRKKIERSEKLYRSILKAALDGYWLTDTNGKLLEVNEAYCRMSGYSEKELLTMHISNLEIIETPKLVAEHMKKVSLKGLDRFNTKHRRKDGTVFDVEVSTQFRTDEGGQCVCFLRDITERKQAAEALKENRNFIDKIINTAPNLVYIYDLVEKCNVYSNDGMKKLLGFGVNEIQEMEKTLFPNLMHPDDFEKVIAHHALLEKSTDGEVFEIDYRMKNKQGVYRILRSWDTMFKRGADGTVQQIIGLAIDVTDQIKAEESLKFEKERAKQYLDVAGVILIALGTDRRVTLINPKGCEILGYPQEEIIGKDWFDNFLFSENIEEIKGVFHQIMSGGIESVEYYENTVKTRAGDSRLIAWHNSILKDSDGNIIGLFSSGEDITEQKRAEGELRESEDFLNRTGDMAKVGGWEVDLNTMKVIWTRTTGRIHELPHGYFPDLEEAISYYHPEDQDHVRQCVQRAIESSEPFDFTVRLITAKGRERWIRALGQPIFDSGSCVRLSGTFQDITERLKLEEELRQSQKMEAIGNLAGGIAHEFNNVLGIILGNAELAIDDVPDWNPAKESLREIRTASFRAKEVVRQILSFARKTMTALKPLEINTIVKESLKLIRASIPAMVDIQTNIPFNPKMILGDPTEIHQIVINLCTNAAHAMKASGGILEVAISEVTLDKRTASRYEDLSPGDFVKLTVKDSGEGIAPDILEKVFEPYFTTKEFGAGSGMGLAVVHGLVKKCKGAIKINSTLEEGTSVEVLFPKIEEEAPAKEKKEVELPRGNERVLLVDDDPSIVNMICQMLERFGYTVTSMTDSTTALERFKSAPDDFDLVITDMSMPKMSGDQLAVELMKIRKDVPILLCTGHSDAVDEKKAKQIGIKGFAMKPLDMGKLASAIRLVLNG